MKIENLKGHIPETVLNELVLVMEKFQINTPLRLAHFLSQGYHESLHFTVVYENLNYDAAGLARTWPKRFAINPNAPVKVPNEIAKNIARKPAMIANSVYADRMGNGNINSGDGWKHRGMGYIQLTGKDNYRSFFQSIGKDPNSDPAEVATKYPLTSAAWFWSVNRLNSLADQGENMVDEITKKVNGGTKGLSERIIYFNKFYKLLN